MMMKKKKKMLMIMMMMMMKMMMMMVSSLQHVRARRTRRQTTTSGHGATWTSGQVIVAGRVEERAEGGRRQSRPRNNRWTSAYRLSAGGEVGGDG